MRRSDPKLRRNKAFKDPIHRFYIFCEGRVSEAKYFVEFSRRHRKAGVLVEIVDDGKSPKTLVEKAAAKRKEDIKIARKNQAHSLEKNEYWCCFDLGDSHAHLPDAIQQAKANSINLAVSNPCFELWLILHIRDHWAHIDSGPAQSLFRQDYPEYKKEVPFTDIWPQYTNAVCRASELDRRSERDGCQYGNPYTGIYLLTERIRMASRDTK